MNSRKAAGIFGLVLLVAGIGAFFLRREFNEVARIEILKTARELRLVNAFGRTIRVYPVALGSQPGAPKRVEGDGATPVGTYFVCVKNPQSKFFLSLGISYPGPDDATRGRREGLISEAEERAIREANERGEAPPWKTRLGGEIFIHGGGAGRDWTQGCVALGNAEMRELYDRIPLGTPVHILP
ncbi:MAG TPA: L,D-transpeptidase [Chthoniobacterales bacterium]